MGACCCCLRADDHYDYSLGLCRGRYCIPGCARCTGGVACAPRAEEQNLSLQDGRYMRTLRDGQITRHDKSGPVQSGESQLSRVSTVETEGEAAAAFENLKSAENKSQSADCKPVSPGKCDSSKLNESIVPFTDEEDCCPTCLEEYDEENPKIITKCEHHFHLACILEWMERSDTCPICDKMKIVLLLKEIL